MDPSEECVLSIDFIIISFFDGFCDVDLSCCSPKVLFGYCLWPTDLEDASSVGEATDVFHWLVLDDKWPSECS